MNTCIHFDRNDTHRADYCFVRVWWFCYERSGRSTSTVVYSSCLLAVFLIHLFSSLANTWLSRKEHAYLCWCSAIERTHHVCVLKHIESVRRKHIWIGRKLKTLENQKRIDLLTQPALFDRLSSWNLNPYKILRLREIWYYLCLNCVCLGISMYELYHFWTDL